MQTDNGKHVSQDRFLTETHLQLLVGAFWMLNCVQTIHKKPMMVHYSIGSSVYTSHSLVYARLLLYACLGTCFSEKSLLSKHQPSTSHHGTHSPTLLRSPSALASSSARLALRMISRLEGPKKAGSSVEWTPHQHGDDLLCFIFSMQNSS